VDRLTRGVIVQGGSKVRQGKGLYWQLFELAPEAYVVSAPDGRIREANRLARQTLNADKSALVGTSLFDLLAESDREAFQFAVRRLLATGWPRQPVELTALVKARNALPFIAQVSASALGDDGHDPHALAWIMRPISPARDGKIAIFAETAPVGPREVARRVDVGLLPVVGAVGQSLSHPGLPPDLKLALAQAAVSLDSAVQWMGSLERAVRGDELGTR
jgi:PAS domain S-box-containing protein